MIFSGQVVILCRRWLRVFEGELLYYKPDDLEVHWIILIKYAC